MNKIFIALLFALLAIAGTTGATDNATLASGACTLIDNATVDCGPFDAINAVAYVTVTFDNSTSVVVTESLIPTGKVAPYPIASIDPLTYNAAPYTFNILSTYPSVSFPVLYDQHAKTRLSFVRTGASRKAHIDVYGTIKR